MMKQIRDLGFQYIVATDLASRGIDIEGISHVINFELPRDLDFYIHRSGEQRVQVIKEWPLPFINRQMRMHLYSWKKWALNLHI